MGRIKTFANAGSLLPGDLNNIEDDYEYAFSTYKLAATLPNTAISAGGINSAATYLLISYNDAGANGVTIPSSNSFAWPAAFYLDPADYAVGSPNARTTKYRLDVSFVTLGVQTGRTSTFGLYPVSSVSGGVPTIGTVTSGSTVAIANPAINTLTHQNSGDFTAPVAGWFAFGFAVAGGGYTASSSPGVSVRLLARQV